MSGPSQASVSFTSFMRRLAEFLEWKSIVEKETNASYSSKKIRTNGTEYHYFSCSWSGYYHPRGIGKRSLKHQGSKKIGGACPSHLTVTEDDDLITVEFIKTHVGHQCDIKHITLSRDTRDRVLSKLCQESPPMMIMSQSPDSHEGDQRIGLPERRTSSSLLPAPSCPTELQPQDFFTAVMKNAQSQVIKKFGNDVIVMDSTHETNAYGFQLTTIMVLDDNRRGFAVAYMVSFRTDTATLHVFFDLICKKCGQITPRTFMTDDFPAFYN